MDVEKYASGKLYMFFEWAFKLVIWNVLSLLIISICASIPVILFYKTQNDYSIQEVSTLEDGIIVTQKNGTKTNIGFITEDREIETYTLTDNIIYLLIDDYTISIPNKDFIREIDKIYFDNETLVIEGMKNTFSYENVLLSPIQSDECKIDMNNHVIIKLENGVEVNFGDKVYTKHKLAGTYMIIAVVLVIFAFIPCFVTNFSMIKIFGEDGSTSTFVLYFEVLWDNFKSLWRLLLIILPFMVLMGFAVYFYYMILTYSSQAGFFYSISYNFILIAIFIFVLWIVTLPMSLAYFRMHTKTLVKFTISMAFRNIVFTILYVVIYAIPVVLCFFNSFFTPVWFLVGFTLPEFVIYQISKKKYRYLVKNFENYKEDDSYELVQKEEK